MSKKARAERINKELFSVYLEKAEEFYRLMKTAESQELWNGAGLNAVHCAISSSDALTTFYLGERSRGQKHEDVVLLLEKIPLEGIKEKTRQIASILAIKNLVEYESRSFYAEDAHKISTQTGRLFKWIKDQLPGK